jgi:hypothetical protein
MDALSFEVSVGEERVYDMSSPSGELCHAPPALRAARPAATAVLLPKSASVNLATTFVVPQTVMSEATNRIEAEVPNEIIQKRASGKRIVPAVYLRNRSTVRRYSRPISEYCGTINLVEVTPPST